ncbi:MAG: hypothetical protein J0M08_10500 [Bacteroidetes bacterium]|nr:hypothetical protein [Bacteroidota bacterium]
MKKVLFSALAILFCLPVLFSQEEGAGSFRKQKKYFVAASYGFGTARWYSTLTNAVIYDKSGNVIRSGEIQFTAKNPTKFYNYEASFPVMKVRMGLGISFEEFYIDQLALSSTPTAAESNLIFDESFRFDKIYFTLEVPFKFDSDKLYSFSATSRLGYFNYNGIERFNFFGEEPMARSFLLNLGLLADYKVLPHVYLFVNPCVEFKYFKNNKDETPSTINHNIVSYNIVSGIRIDVSKE